MTDTLASENVVIEAPMSFIGSTKRIHRLFAKWYADKNGVSDWTIAVLFAVLETFALFTAWTVVASWYMTFGLLLVPYRLIRRGQRKDARNSLRHREMVEAIKER